jgi:nitrite reductase/ring-hydroxylating ferredoxin subunit
LNFIIIVLSEEGFVKVADKSDIQPSHMKEVQVDGESICIVNVKGKYYAIGNICMLLAIFALMKVVL